METAAGENGRPVLERLRGALGEMALDWQRPRANRCVVRIEPVDNVGAARAMIETLGARLATASGVDLRDGVEINYHFCLDADHMVVTLKTLVPKPEPHVASISCITAGAEWIEREMFDLLGCRFDGHPQPERLILADDWPLDNPPLQNGGPK